MIQHPNFDPVAIAIGPLSIHWYGLMYVLGFVGVYLLGCRRIARYPNAISGQWTPEQVSDLIFYGALGVVFGGRLGYVVFYKPIEYLAEPLQIFMLNQGGMSFHGGLIGVILATVWFARKTKKSILQVGDFVAPLAPIGLFFGRMGNFINQELWGKPTDLPWGMVFTTADSLPRHPSMLYEALLEGVLLFVILWFFSKKSQPIGVLSGYFLVGYAVARMMVELVRVPDAHLNYLMFDWLTMGHVLSLPMVVIGTYLIWKAK